jgi:hypothetical protein
MGIIHAKGFEYLMVDHLGSRSWLGTLFIVCFIITGVLALLNKLICIRNYLLARGWIANQQNLPNRPREYNVNYHGNSDFSDNEEDELSRILRKASMC